MSSRVTIYLDGRPIEAEGGESAAHALLRAGVRTFSRSVKYHRPRGPFCLEGACAQCYMRADGVPDVPTCRLPARDGMKLERQNAFPGAELDLLRAVDVVYREGLDHHHLMVHHPWLQRAAQAVARRLSGLGRLPDAPLEPRAAEERETDVAVVGAGRHGHAAARAAADAGLRVLLVDAGPDPGPSRDDAGIEVRSETRAVALYPDDPPTLLLAHGEVARVVRARRVVVATGSHPQPVPFPGSDLPGVFAGRGLKRLVERGVLPGRRAAVCGGAGGSSAEARELAQLLTEAGAAEVHLFDPDPEAGPMLGAEVHPGLTPVRALGFARVRALECAPRRGGTPTRVACDLVAVVAPRAPAYELAAQAGAPVDWLPAGGFAVRVSPQGETPLPWLFACGACAGGRARGADAGRAAVLSLLVVPSRQERAAR